MDVIEFNGKIYYKNKEETLFLYEPLWQIFRPLDIKNPNNKGELFDEYYGFGTKEMKRYCEILSIDLNNKIIIKNPLFFYRWTKQEIIWNKDRITLKDFIWNFSKKKTFRKSPKNINNKTLRNFKNVD